MMPRAPRSSARGAGPAASRRTTRLPFFALLAVAAAAWRYGLPTSFVSGAGAGAGPSHAPGAGLRGRSARRAFAFDLVETDDHQDLSVKKEDSNTILSTQAPDRKGHWNTVLGDKELPAKGRHYWEVKILEKPTDDSWEYYGVAEKSDNVTEPLIRNMKSKAFFGGFTRREFMFYQWWEIKKEWAGEDNKRYVDAMVTDELDTYYKRYPKMEADKIKADFTKQVEGRWKNVGKGSHVGSHHGDLPGIRAGTVVGIDVDMDAGTMAYWIDGNYGGVVMDHTNRPVDLKGKKVFPAFSVYGRTMNPVQQFNKIEVRTGLEPPERPSDVEFLGYQPIKQFALEDA